MSEAMARWRPGLVFGGFIVGGLFGGYAHMYLLFDAALAALARSGTNPWLFTTKPVGENMFFLAYFYGVGMLASLLIFACFGIVRLFRTIGHWRRGTLTPRSRPSVAALASLTAGASLGALCAAIVSLQMVTGEYVRELAYEEKFAVASASAVPEMRSLTGVYASILLALCIGAIAVQVFQARQRRV